MNKKKFALMAASVALVASTVLFGTLAYFTDRESVTNVFTVGNIDILLDEAVVNPYGEPLKDNVVVKDYINDKGEIVKEDAQGNPITTPEVDRTQDPTDADEKEGNNYKLVPGRTYVKDPTLTVVKGSEPAYVAMLVTISHVEVFDAIFDALDEGIHGVKKPELTDIFNGYDAERWECVGEYRSDETTTPGTITYKFLYRDTDGDAIVDAREANENIVLEPLFDSFTVPGFFGNEQIKDLDGMTITVIGQAIQSDTFADENAAWDAFDSQVAVNGKYKSPYATTTGNE